MTMKAGPADAMKAHLEILLGDTIEDNKRLKRDGKKPRGDAELLDLYGLALVYNRSEKEACEFFQDAIAIAPDRIDSYKHLASVLRGTLQQDAEADAAIESMIAKNPKSVDAYEQYVTYFLMTGKKDNVDRAYGKARELLKLARMIPAVSSSWVAAIWPSRSSIKPRNTFAKALRHQRNLTVSS